MNQSQATDLYMSMTDAEKVETARRAVDTQDCFFCGEKAGHRCRVIPGKVESPPLDSFAHCGRWMRYLMEEDMKVWVRVPNAVVPNKSEIETDLRLRGGDLVLTLKWDAGKTVEVGVNLEELEKMLADGIEEEVAPIKDEKPSSDISDLF